MNSCFIFQRLHKAKLELLNSPALNKSIQAATKIITDKFENGIVVLLWFLLSYQPFAVSVYTSTEVERESPVLQLLVTSLYLHVRISGTSHIATDQHSNKHWRSGIGRPTFSIRSFGGRTISTVAVPFMTVVL